MTEDRHIVSSYDGQLKDLNAKVHRMGALALEAVAESMIAMRDRDEDKAQHIIENDSVIDALHQDIQEAAVEVLALRQPVANDLRTVVSALRVTSELERIGDYASNIAKRTMALGRSQTEVPSVRVVVRMGQLAHEILSEVLKAYDKRDAAWSEALWHRDVEVDDLHTSLFRELLTYMMEDPRYITPCTHLIFAAKNIERIGDHASNVAEITYYMATAEPIPGERPKADQSSSVAEPGE